MRSHAKASTAGSTRRQAGLGRTRFAQGAVLTVAIASLLAFTATPASASLLRSYESSFGTFSGSNPQALTVDQSNGDVYAISTSGNSVSRFDSAGAAKNFTAGPDAGTNTLTGFSFDGPSAAEVAIDDSGGPANGDVYVTNSFGGAVEVFANDGTPLGSLDGSETPSGSYVEPCGVAVDQANGDVYVADFENRVWRYSPSGGPVEESDYSGGIATPFNPCQLAVASGSLYVHNWQESPNIGVGPLRKFATSSFTEEDPPPSPSSTVLDPSARVVATDPSNGDVYVDEGNKIVVFSAAGATKYSFGSAADFGTSSAGVAVRVGGGAYVADPTAHQIDVYGRTLEPGKRANLFSFGTFSGSNPQALTVDQSNGDVYAISTSGNSVSRFDSNGAAKNFTAGPDAGTNTLTGFSFDGPSAAEVAIDDSGGPASGDIYVTNSFGGAVKVFANDGTPLGSLDGSETPSGSYGEPCGVAVDQANGDVYVADFENRVWRYSPAGGPVEESDYSGGIATAFNPCQLAVASGSLYVHNWQESPNIGVGPLRKFATSAFALGPPPSPSSTVLDPSARAVATDPSNGDVYVDEGNKIAVFSAAGATKYSFGSAADFGTSSAGVAIEGGGNAYVSDPTNHQVDVYGPFSAPPPLVETKAATNVKHTKATLQGHLDPNGSLPITGCEFEWGTDTNYSEAPIPCAEGSSFTSPADVSAELSGLTPGTTYHFRLQVTTSAGGFDGEDQSFEAIPASSVPEVSTGQGSFLSAGSAELSGTIDPNALALTDCHFEYVNDIPFQETGFSDLSSGGSVPCDQAPGSIPADFEDHAVTATVGGLDPAQLYRFRLVAENANGPGVGAAAFVPGPPLVESTGSPIRSATTARLDSRVDPHGVATTYHFEYGDQGPCDANPCTATAPQAAGSGNAFEFVSQQIEGLQPNTTYHYRVLADDANPGGAAAGGDMTLTTRASDAPLTHGHFPGPPGSDRAWEQVSSPDTGGNPVAGAPDISDEGNRVVYQIRGGNPDSETGTLYNDLFAERTPSGWQSRRLFPTRTEAPGNLWSEPTASSDLSRLVALNTSTAGGSSTADTWRLSPDVPAQHVYGVPHDDYAAFTAVSDDASRIVASLRGSLDPNHPVAPGSEPNLYDVTSGTPHLVSLLPDGSVPTCGTPYALPGQAVQSRSQHWLTPDGSHLVFYSAGSGACEKQFLYVRDLDTETTSQISTSGSNNFIRSTADAVFFLASDSLVPGDTGGEDVYRYDLGGGPGALKCVTCVVPGLNADVSSFSNIGSAHDAVAVSDDGSRVYFESAHELLPGAVAAPRALYRVDVASGDLAYVGPTDVGDAGDRAFGGNAINPDGSVFVFWSASPGLNAINGPSNGGTAQYYLYDDNDRSLVCVSCPADGSPPRAGVDKELIFRDQIGPNATPLSDAGDFAFVTPTALVSADQNTAGPSQAPKVGSDVYEWRDGRVLLVTDGLTATPNVPFLGAEVGPQVAGVSPSGRDVFFKDAAQLTPDAIDAYERLYDARIGGGFEFPVPPPPCPLDACQGTPKGAPEEPRPGSLDFSGAGNQGPAPARCRKGKVRRRGRCVSKHQKKRAKRAQHKANHDRRAGR